MRSVQCAALLQRLASCIAQQNCPHQQLATSTCRASGLGWLLQQQVRGLVGSAPQLRHTLHPSCPHQWAALTRKHPALPWSNQTMRSFAQKSSGGFGNLPPVTMQGLIIFMMLGATGIAAIKTYKDEKVKQVMVQSQEVVGKASVGGPFSLIDYNSKKFTDRDLRGEFALLYFGFTHCPDICPDELEKVAEAVNIVDKETGVFIVPVFISVDPERDTPARIKSYVTDFHPRMLGLTGALDTVKEVSKSYRVYFSKTGAPGAKDYLVDHSIIHYLIDPHGEFVTFYGKNYTAEQMAASLREHVAKWKADHPDDYHPGKSITAPSTSSSSVAPK